MGREWGARREELVFHGDVLQWCRGLVWLEFWVSHWALGWVLHHQPWGFLSLYFRVPVITLGPTMGLQAYSPQHPTFLLLQNPLEQMGKIPMGANPCSVGFVNNPAPFGVQQTQFA